MGTGTVSFHRVLKATPDRVYRAFLDPDAMVKRLPPHGFTGKVDHVDARVGGTFRMSFTNFSTGSSHSYAEHGIRQSGARLLSLNCACPMDEP